MKKSKILILVSGFLFMTGVKAQTIQEGMNHLYADRFRNAINIFQKLLAVNPNNIDATYWLGQTYLDMDDNDAARQVYEKALMANGNVPLLLVGMGHVELLGKKTDKARQMFETAISLSKNKKGQDDPFILNAIGRANVDAKAGDLAYAIEKLEAAVLRDPKNADIFLNLGNAYRKARPGEGGGQAYQSYRKALEVNPNFAYAYIRLAKIFETQQNWDLVFENLTEAITKDPGFSLAYYELFYYYWWYKKDYTEAENMLKKYIDSRPNEDQTEHDYLYSQLCWARNDYDCAISKAESVARSMGVKIKPKVYRQLAYSYFGKGNFANAKRNVDILFSKEKDNPVTEDYKLKADIYSGIGVSSDSVVIAFLDAVNSDTTLKGKIDLLKKGAETLKAKGDSISRLREGDLRLTILNLKSNPGQRDYFDAGFAYYQGKDYTKSDSLFVIYTQKWPDELFGWQMEFSIQRAIDTSMALGLAVPAGIKYLEVLEKDTVKNKKTIIGVAGYLAQYYANIAKDKEKAIVYLEKMLLLDPTNENFKKYLDDMKSPPTKPVTNPRNNSSGKTNGNNNLPQPHL
jgi:tetratricopeptide (TPR) repeat protein